MTSALIGLPTISLAAPPSEAAPPDFHAPWKCGETWFGATYPHHGNGDLALDFNEADNAEAGRPVLAAGAGVVHASDTEFFDPSDDRVIHGDLRMADETELRVGDGAAVSLWRFNGQLYIDHGNGWYSFYGHLDPSRPSVEDGTQVEAGDVLGFVDRTPNPLQAFGAHLHYEQKHDSEAPFSVYEAKTQRMQFQGMPVPDPGPFGSVQVLSLNCDGDPDAAALALQAASFEDDVAVIGGAGADAMRIRRYLVDADQMMRSRDRVNLRLARVDDRVLTGDFTNDGLDDLAVVGQQLDGSFQIRVWSEGRYRVGSFHDPSARYTLGLNQGRMAVGDFDADGFTDDIVMAKAFGRDRLRLVRYLFDGPEKVTITRQVVAIPPGRVGDRMLVGDFDNDGTDDVAFVVQQVDGSFQVKVWSSAEEAAGVYLDAGWQYSLKLNQGRLISGDFDGDGYTDDIVMAKRLGPNHLSLRRFLLDGARNATTSRELIRTQPGRAEGQLLRGDFDNDGTDDAALIIRQRGADLRMMVWSQATEAAGSYLLPGSARGASLVLSGNFDRS